MGIIHTSTHILGHYIFWKTISFFVSGSKLFKRNSHCRGFQLIVLLRVTRFNSLAKCLYECLSAFELGCTFGTSTSSCQYTYIHRARTMRQRQRKAHPKNDNFELILTSWKMHTFYHCHCTSPLGHVNRPLFLTCA